jgi:succinoglycan biosynthesis transport protein ExoP
MLWKGKWKFLVIWAAISAAGIVVVHNLPTIYTAQALIQVDSQKIPERFVSSTVSSDLQDRISSISQQILSSGQLNKMINDFGLYRAERKQLVQEEIIEKMRKDIEIKVDRNAGTAKNRPGSFRVTYHGTNPSVVAQVANRVSELFINENLRAREVQAEGTSEFIESQLQEAKKTLDSLEAAVGAYKSRHNGELPQQENALGANVARLQQELNATRDVISRANDSTLILDSSLSAAEATLQALQEQAAADLAARSAALTPGQAITMTMNPNASGRMVPMPPKRSDVLRNQLDTLRSKWRDDHPEVKRLKADLAQAEEVERANEEAALAAAKAAAAARLPEVPKPAQTAAATPAVTVPPPPLALRDTPQMSQLRDRIQGLKTQIALNARELEKRKVAEQRLTATISEVQSRIERLPLREQEMAVLSRDYQMSKDNYQRLLASKLSAEMSKDMEVRQKSERFVVLDPATVPEKPSKPNRLALSAGISGAGLFLGLLLVFLIEFRRDVFLGEWELPKEVVVLGTLPRMAHYVSAGGQETGSGRTWFRKSVWIGSGLLGVAAVAAAGLILLGNRF